LEHFINILLLDQNKTIIAGLKTILSSGGNNLIVCQTISEAIKQIEKREIGIILINISDDIDDSLKQLDQLRQCENENSFYTLLICNKNISEGNIVKGFNKGAVDYIKHPFNPNLVKAKINVFKIYLLILLHSRKSLKIPNRLA